MLGKAMENNAGGLVASPYSTPAQAGPHIAARCRKARVAPMMTDTPIHAGLFIDALYGDRRFVVWRLETVNGRPTKVPYIPGVGGRARTDDRMTWRSHAEAQATLEKGAVDGIGYVLTQRDGLAAIDLDHCLDVDGTLLPWASDLVKTSQSYTEITPSKFGLRIIGIVTGPLADLHFRLSRGANGEAIEGYHRAVRYITLSRVPFGPERPLADITAVMATLAQEHAERAGTAGETSSGSAGLIPLATLPASIQDLIRHGSVPGTRSDKLMKVVAHLRRAGHVRAAIKATLRAHPDGIAARCFEHGKDDLHRQVQLCVDKIDDDEATRRRQQRLSQAASGWRENSISARALQQQQFPPMKHVIPGLLTEGLTLFCGKPKKGKTWLALDIAISVASLRICLGDFVPVQGDVLYIALEDNSRRLQRRLKHILVHDDTVWPDRLTFAFTWRRLNEGGLDDLVEWLGEHPGARLIVVDTFAAVRAVSKDYGYNEDYSALAGLQRFAGERGIAVLVVHHLRKAGADDFGDEISGTLGLTAAVDGYLVLRGDGSSAELCLRSRDIEEQKFGASFNKETCRWTLDRSSEHDRSKHRILNVLCEAEEPLSPAEIVRLTGLTRNVVDTQLYRLRLNGEVCRENSRYSLGGMA
jgi:hypothetical protein